MTQQEIQDALKTLRDEHKQSYFAIKQITQGEDYYIEANRNGILTYCNFLLDSISSKHLEKSTYDIPDSFWDDSDIWLPIKIQEGNKIQSPVKDSVLTQAGCFLALGVFVIVLIVGMVTSISWLLQLFD